MDSQTLDKQFTAVALLCNKYLQKDLEAMRLLNKILNMAADFAIIDHKALDNSENEMDDYKMFLHFFQTTKTPKETPDV